MGPMQAEGILEAGLGAHGWILRSPDGASVPLGKPPNANVVGPPTPEKVPHKLPGRQTQSGAVPPRMKAPPTAHSNVRNSAPGSTRIRRALPVTDSRKRVHSSQLPSKHSPTDGISHLRNIPAKSAAASTPPDPDAKQDKERLLLSDNSCPRSNATDPPEPDAQPDYPPTASRTRGDEGSEESGMPLGSSRSSLAPIKTSTSDPSSPHAGALDSRNSPRTDSLLIVLKELCATGAEVGRDSLGGSPSTPPAAEAASAAKAASDLSPRTAALVSAARAMVQQQLPRVSQGTEPEAEEAVSRSTSSSADAPVRRVPPTERPLRIVFHLFNLGAVFMAGAIGGLLMSRTSPKSRLKQVNAVSNGAIARRKPEQPPRDLKVDADAPLKFFFASRKLSS